MLVLTRKQNEKIWIEVDGLDEPIQVCIGDVQHHRVKIGLIADQAHVRIYRDEVYTRVLQERINALKPPQTENVTCPALPTVNPLSPPSSKNA